MVPGMHPHSDPVAVDMAIAFLALELLPIDRDGRILIPRRMHKMDLPEAIQHIQTRNSVEGKREKRFNDNTVCLAAIQATKQLASCGTVVCKEEALYDLPHALPHAITTDGASGLLLDL